MAAPDDGGKENGMSYAIRATDDPMAPDAMALVAERVSAAIAAVEQAIALSPSAAEAAAHLESVARHSEEISLEEMDLDAVTTALRRALQALQSAPAGPAALDRATEQVAEALGSASSAARGESRSSSIPSSGSGARGRPSLVLVEDDSPDEPRHGTVLETATEPGGPSENDATGAQEPDRRAAARVALHAEVGLHTETNLFSGFSEDVSDGGLFLATYDLLPIDTAVSVAFSLPTGDVQADGRVAWVREARDGETTPGMGIRFEALTDPAKEAIQEFVRVRPPLFYDD